MNDESHIFAELLGDEDLLTDKKVIGTAKVQGHDLTLEQFTLPEGWQEHFPGLPGNKIEAVHIHPKAANDKTR